MSCSTASRELRRSASSIATELWSPEELFSVDTQVDVLQPILKPVGVDARRFYAFRLSVLLAPFEVLQDFWAPAGESSGLLSDDGVVSVRCAEMRWDGRPDATTTGTIAEQCKPTSWLRLTSTLAHRTFVVDRSAAHVQTLVAALRYTFPHLLFPSDGEATEPTCRVLVQFIVHHWSALSAYLPLLYFLFEVQERAFSGFYKQLGTTLLARKGSDAAACDALKPKKGGKMFSWFSSKPKEAELGVNDKLEIINTHKATLPPAFEKRYMIALAQLEQVKKMQLFCREYVSSLHGEASAYQALAEGLAAHPLASSAVTGWYSPEAAEAPAKENAAVKQVATSVQRFALRKSSLVNELLLPLLKAVSQCECELGVIATSHVAFYEELAMRAKAVGENTPLLSGKVPLPTGCDASTRPEMMASAREVNRRYTLEFSDWRQQFDTEVAYAEAAIKARVKRLCVLCGDVVATMVSCTKAEYYEEYLRPLIAVQGEGDSASSCAAAHPLQACLAVKDRCDESPYAVDRNSA
ncbi:hypothetical protein NESM_000694100 [Novymonas esmeraldas]|uniref:Uncharacterized protein n=1 Tax=Novymonas esmeraldas TaxID=1808958 RepID=A0AAW0ET90_9TRYP